MKSQVKSIILGVITLILALFFWYTLSNLLSLKANFSTLILNPIAFFIFAISCSLFCFLIDLKSVSYITFVLLALSFLFFFGFSILYVVGLVLLFCGLIWGYAKIKTDKNTRIKVCFRKSLSLGLSIILTFLVIIISIAYYSASVKAIQERGLVIPKKFFEAIFGSFEGVISGFIPGFKKDMSLDELSLLLTVGMLEKEMPEKLELTPEIERFLKEEGIDVTSKEEVFRAIKENPKVREKFTGIFKKEEEGGEGLTKAFEGLGIKGDEPLSEALYKLTNQKINQIIGPYKKYIPLASSVGLFVVLKIIMIPFGWLVMLFSWIVYAVLLALKVVRIEKVQKEVETVRM